MVSIFNYAKPFIREGGVKKTMTFAVMHFSVAFAVAYVLTGSVVIGGAVALVEPAINTIAFYFHELVWKKFESKGQRYSNSYARQTTNHQAMHSM